MLSHKKRRKLNLVLFTGEKKKEKLLAGGRGGLRD